MKKLLILAFIFLFTLGCATSRREIKLSKSKSYRTVAVDILDHTYTGIIQDAINSDMGRAGLIVSKNPALHVGGEFFAEPAIIKGGEKTIKFKLILEYKTEGRTWKAKPIEWEATGLVDTKIIEDGVKANLYKVMQIILKEATLQHK